VLGGSFDKDNYIEERVWATAKMELRCLFLWWFIKKVEKDGENPLLLYAYGSYGHSMDAHFSSTRLSLLDRGFVYAMRTFEVVKI
jgi:oligopeptidase B